MTGSWLGEDVTTLMLVYIAKEKQERVRHTRLAVPLKAKREGERREGGGGGLQRLAKRKDQAGRVDATHHRRMKLAQGLKAGGLLDDFDMHNGQMVLAVGDGTRFAPEQDATGCPRLAVALHTCVMRADQLLGSFHLLQACSWPLNWPERCSSRCPADLIFLQVKIPQALPTTSQFLTASQDMVLTRTRPIWSSYMHTLTQGSWI